MLAPTDIRSIQACIHDLNYVIENWEYFASCDPEARLHLDAGSTTRGIFDVDYGLCYNVFGPNDLADHIKLTLFLSWDGFSGDIIYPVGGEDEYECNDGNLYLNPARKSLALHCVKYLSYLLEL